ncbi:MAG: hypothetical protein Q8S06_10015 [Methanobacteriaceae archaeon]|nr:hypothetical protein [Methanobacteriaceae archaeon]
MVVLVGIVGCNWFEMFGILYCLVWYWLRLSVQVLLPNMFDLQQEMRDYSLSMCWR